METRSLNVALTVVLSVSLLINLWLAPAAAQWVFDDDGCPTPDGGVGNCVAQHQCPALKDLRRTLPATANLDELLRGYHCGVLEGTWKICCPSGPIIIQTLTPDQDTTATTSTPTTSTTITYNERLSKIPDSDKSDCITPNIEPGNCIPIRECKPMISFLQQSSKTLLSTEAVSVLQGYQCSNENNVIKVCCPDGPIAVRTTIIKAPEIDTAPDITSHKNLNLLPYECGSTQMFRIVNGNKTELLQYPWMALLAYQIGNAADFKCGGTIINDMYILTAAHCLTSSLKLIAVRVGEHDLTKDPDCEISNFGDEYCAPPVQNIAVAESIPHPEWNSTTLVNDIGLVRLAWPINMTVENARPICLPISKQLRERNIDKDVLTVTGWGYTETARKSNDLLQVHVPVMDEEACREIYKNTSAVLNHRQICAGGTSKGDSCGGDSGGPLKTSLLHNDDFRFVQLGVVSFGPRICGLAGYPGVYTKVIYYLDWILDNLKP